MNIFYLDHDPVLAAKAHYDAHVVKMPLETAQILCTVHHIWFTNTPEMYKPTHKRHPSVLWTARAREHYVWTYQLFYALLDEYHYRYERTHASGRLLTPLADPPFSMPWANGFEDPPQAMPTYCQNTACSVTAYRQYYCTEKLYLQSYKKRQKPEWLQKEAKYVY